LRFEVLSVAIKPRDYPWSMPASLESVMVSVWQQALIDKKITVDLDGQIAKPTLSAKLPRAN
jgi:hypothetical protein